MCKTRNIFINLLVIFFIIVLVIFNNNVSANLTVADGNIYYYEITNEEVKLTQCYFHSFPTVKIPKEIEGYPVTIIASYAAGFNSIGGKIDNIIIPDSVVTIEQDAFLIDEINVSDCIKDFTIPKSVQNIGLNALGYYAKLEHYSCGSTELFWKYCKIDDFVIKGYKGTAAETYALRNRFTFIALDDEPITTTTPVTTDITTTETTVVTTQTTPITTIPDITENIIGDVNGDGKLTASDAAFIAKTLAEALINNEKIEAKDYPIMDFNQDGKITAKDAADIARYLADKLIT